MQKIIAQLENRGAKKTVDLFILVSGKIFVENFITCLLSCRCSPTMWKGFALALALCLLPWGGAESQGHHALCKKPPDWKIGAQNPMLDSDGSVTVVALLSAS